MERLHEPDKRLRVARKLVGRIGFVVQPGQWIVEWTVARREAFIKAATIHR